MYIANSSTTTKKVFKKKYNLYAAKEEKMVLNKMLNLSIKEEVFTHGKMIQTKITDKLTLS